MCVSCAGVWYFICPRPFLPVSSPLLPLSLPLSALLSLQPALPQTGGQAMPLRSACCERWVTEPDNTTNCSIFEEIKHSVCLKFHYLFAFLPPPLINLALYAKQWSSSKVESNKLRLCESCKATNPLYPYFMN